MAYTAHHFHQDRPFSREVTIREIGDPDRRVIMRRVAGVSGRTQEKMVHSIVHNHKTGELIEVPMMVQCPLRHTRRLQDRSKYRGDGSLK